jgi:TIR domain/Domain of unknown function (DUF6430)
LTAQIFVSHCHEDQAAYTSLCLALDNSGVSRWDVSELSLGKSLAEGLRTAIEECDICVFLATSRSLKSQWCLAELGAFWGAGKRVLIFQADPNILESEHPPQFHGNLWTSDAKQLLKAINQSDGIPVRRLGNGYSVILGAMTVNVLFGKIEEIDHFSDDWLVALPANEFFDDECIHDSRSSLGAFMKRHFDNRVMDIQAMVKDSLVNEKYDVVKKTPEKSANSYGVGRCVFLEQPLSSRLRVAMVSVTTHRADVGLRADPSYIFAAAASLQRLMANKRLSRVCIPILGSGHGGLKGEISLACMLTAFAELSRSTAQNLREVNIIVFRRDEVSPPSVSESSVKYALNYARRLWGGEA